MFERLAQQATAELRGDGFSSEHIRIARALDMRYAGQGYEVTVPCPAAPPNGDGLEDLRAAFDARHQSMFGHMAPEQPVEIVSYRVRGTGLVPDVEMPRFERTGATLADARREVRRATFDGEERDCPVYRRERLDVGACIAGPAVLEQLDCTTVIVPARPRAWTSGRI